jgi:hypothetical protein
MQDKHA